MRKVGLHKQTLSTQAVVIYIFNLKAVTICQMVPRKVAIHNKESRLI